MCAEIGRIAQAEGDVDKAHRYFVRAHTSDPRLEVIITRLFRLDKNTAGMLFEGV